MRSLRHGLDDTKNVLNPLCAADCVTLRCHVSCPPEAGAWKTGCRETRKRPVKRALWEDASKCWRKKTTYKRSWAPVPQAPSLGWVAGASWESPEQSSSLLTVLWLTVLMVAALFYPSPLLPYPTQVTPICTRTTTFWVIKKHNWTQMKYSLKNWPSIVLRWALLNILHASKNSSGYRLSWRFLPSWLISVILSTVIYWASYVPRTVVGLRISSKLEW